MNKTVKFPSFSGVNTLFLTIVIGLSTGILPLSETYFPENKIFASEENQAIEAISAISSAAEASAELGGKLTLIEENSLVAISNPENPEPEAVKTIKVVVTAYSSTVWETDDTPFTTACGSTVRDGIVATNFLPFGTKIRIPEVYGNKIFVVEDRMNPFAKYHVDVWFPSYWEALNFGAKWTYIEVLN